MDKEKMLHEHSQLKEWLQELTDFINSEEYYKLGEAEKQLMAAQRSGMEVYINALSIRLWGKGNVSGTYSPSLLGLVTSMLFAPNFGSPMLQPTIPDEGGENAEEPVGETQDTGEEKEETA